ncbi:SDR family NAD(P)-dependent oxidoreductase [Aeromicrobium sp. 636]|uniref:SDR family NAD(P)-dependent oxidoreductase n=1 Tax=Aeromicrobium senzhongii TaxID=2663859 RepID=A0A8I0K1G2_9ACTN|nr:MULTISPECIES: SDR family NAD(P)-dependent oxidoreductase [Aeromicrobium]MBC9227496.1 SDR family NAD(P)-dependent oxidoreductase [Aeromicrobium senzhongii]MCQ3999593.1 SDR family NAD(P)-dependent oxidoreductase [Aeromicrobium sp. 636]
MTQADIIDAEVAADDTISFSRLGYERRRPTWDDADLADVAGSTVIVSGGTAGVGLGASTSLAALGAHVVMLGRSAERGEAAVREITAATGNENVEWVRLDLASLASVRATAAELLERCPRIDVLINNAGGMWDTWETSADGIEMSWATNVVGPYLLTELLLDRLAESAPARIIEMTSGGAYSQRLTLGELRGEEEAFDPKATYSRTKRAQIVLTELRGEAVADRGIVAHVTHPGWTDSPGLRESGAMANFIRRFEADFRTPEQGADTAVWLAAAREPGRSTGLFWHDRRPRETHRTEATRESEQDRLELIELLRKVTGLAD